MGTLHIERAREIVAATGDLPTVDEHSEMERLRAVLREADELLEVAYYAHQKMGLEGRGDDCSLSSEVRWYALHFSRPESTPLTPGKLSSGDGRYLRLRQRQA